MATLKWFSLLLLVTGCFRGVQPADAVVRVPEAHAFAHYGPSVRPLPSDLSPEIISDNATLSIAPTEFCFDLQLRAPRGVDLALGSYNLRCQLDRRDTWATVVSESPPTTTEYPYTSETWLLITGTQGALSLPIVPAQQARVLHVVERKGRACCPAHPTREVRLVATSELPNAPGGVEIVWRWPLSDRSSAAR